MINLKEMLTENRDLSARKGCLMAMVSEEDTAKILQFSKQLIKDEDLYLEGNEYGRETESHVTIRYGFLKDLNELDIRQLLKGQKPFMMEIFGLDKFASHPQYDVAMFKVNSPVLKKLNELSGVYLNESDFPDYTPHLTLAYVQKGKFNNLKEGLKLQVPIRKICYSPISGAKSYFDLEENNVHYDIDSKIARLEQEWDRLDSTGTGTERQQQIQQELIKLRAEKAKQPLSPNDPKTKELWDKMRQSLEEIEYPLAKKGELQSYEGHAGWKGKIVWMPPQKFLNMVHPLPDYEMKDASYWNLRKRMEKQLPIDFLVLKVDSQKKKVIGHEGRHRATVAKEMGVEKVPVLIYFEEGYPRVPKWGPEHHEFADKAEFKPEWDKT